MLGVASSPLHVDRTKKLVETSAEVNETGDVESAVSLTEALDIVAKAESSLDFVTAGAALRRLPVLLAAEAIPDDCTSEKLAQRLATGEAIRMRALPSRPASLSQTKDTPPGKRRRKEGDATACVSFLWVLKRVEATVADARILSAVPLHWLIDLAGFLAKVSLEPAVSRNVLHEAANEVQRRLRQVDFRSSSAMDAFLPGACRFVCLAAVSGLLAEARDGALARHPVIVSLAKRIASVTSMASKFLSPGGSSPVGRLAVRQCMIHDCALALALTRPWENSASRAAEDLLSVVAPPEAAAQPSTALTAVCASPQASGESVDTTAIAARVLPLAVAGATAPGSGAVGNLKENQDAFLVVNSVGAQTACVLDGHGKHGTSVTAALHRFFECALPHVTSGNSIGKALADTILAADTALLLRKDIDARLCGACCAIVRVEEAAHDGPGLSTRRLSVAHCGDCRVILGRRKEGCRSGNDGSNGPSWHALRLTRDHVLQEPSEAARLVASGGRLQAPPHVNGQGATDVTGVGVPRLWSRVITGAPGLAVSRGLGDVLAQTCGFSPEASVLEAWLRPEDLVVVVASDGVFDVLPDPEVLQRCLPYRRSRDAAAAAVAIVAAAGRAWAALGAYRDDATCIVMFV
eukprot:TRINITY_DN34441_c0_g1_i1.p1 TRINITY_DN34441_c0_g1~~TRINITY_DN34441_c0_g1_i1.p1  ORF type:complete len:636 (-),score=110.53 TRINITY_DN34441_c0_g1_i1:38-1945(-)